MKNWLILFLPLLFLSFKKDETSFERKHADFPVAVYWDHFTKIRYALPNNEERKTCISGKIYAGPTPTNYNTYDLSYFNPYNFRIDSTHDFSVRAANYRPWPVAARYYLDPNKVSLENDSADFGWHIRTEMDERNTDFYQPFFFANREVSNHEYRQFVNTVKDSILRDHLARVYPEKYARTNRLLEY